MDHDLESSLGCNWLGNKPRAWEAHRLLIALGPIRAALAATTLLSTGTRCLWCLIAIESTGPSQRLRCMRCGVSTYCSEEHMQRAMAAHHAFQTYTSETEVRGCHYVEHDKMADSIHIQCKIFKTVTEKCNQYVAFFASHGQPGLDKQRLVSQHRTKNS